jgi:hypothetical protein
MPPSPYANGSALMPPINERREMTASRIAPPERFDIESSSQVNLSRRGHADLIEEERTSPPAHQLNWNALPTVSKASRATFPSASAVDRGSLGAYTDWGLSANSVLPSTTFGRRPFRRAVPPAARFHENVWESGMQKSVPK